MLTKKNSSNVNHKLVNIYQVNQMIYQIIITFLIAINNF